MDGLLGLVRCRVQFKKRRRLGDDVPAWDVREELLRAFDSFPQGRELRLVQRRQVGDRVALRSSVEATCFGVIASVHVFARGWRARHTAHEVVVAPTAFEGLWHRSPFLEDPLELEHLVLERGNLL